MRSITMYLDFVSPYAWLALEKLPMVLDGMSCHVRYRPVLLGALLQAHHNPGPAGIAPKRVWTYRHVQWLGQAQGTPLQMPAEHPFNPLPLLRLALACSDDGFINRFTARSIFQHVWAEGGDALDADRLAHLRGQLQHQLRTDSEAEARAKQLLRSNTDAAVQAGVFGAPSFEVDGQLFFGLDSLEMLRAYLLGDAWFASEAWTHAAQISSGI